MQTQAQIKNVIVDLAGPLPQDVTEVEANIARRTLSWCLGNYGAKTFNEAVFDAPPPPAPAAHAPTEPAVLPPPAAPTTP